MNDFFKIVLTACTTLIGGTALLLLSKIFVEPIHELKKIIGEQHMYSSLIVYLLMLQIPIKVS